MKDPLKRYRRRFRSWKNRVRLKRELEGYEAAFASRGLAIPDDSAIRQALQNRFPGSGPKPKGALSIIAVYHHYNWEEGALKPPWKIWNGKALRLVQRVRPSGRDWRSSVKAEMNRDLVVRIGQWGAANAPDVIFTYLSGEIVFPETVQALRSFGIPMIHFSLNDKEHFVGKVRGGLAFGSRDICRWFDLARTSTEDALKKYCAEGRCPLISPKGITRSSTDPGNSRRPSTSPSWGSATGTAPETIRRLSAEGIRVGRSDTAGPMAPSTGGRWSASTRKAGSTSGSGCGGP